MSLKMGLLPLLRGKCGVRLILVEILGFENQLGRLR
jgi:hypothetical protein